jgi:hypothetical protein
MFSTRASDFDIRRQKKTKKKKKKKGEKINYTRMPELFGLSCPAAAVAHLQVH